MSPLAGDHPQVAGVAQAGAVADERLLGLVLGLHQHDRAVELAGAHEAAADGLLHVAPEPGTDVARDLDALIRPSRPASGRSSGGCSRVRWPLLKGILPFAGCLSEGVTPGLHGKVRRSQQGEGRMGFMDKAKQLAEQAQQKLDETQKNFNKSSSPEGQPQGDGVKYDEHGRPIQEAPPAGATAPPAAEPAAPAHRPRSRRRSSPPPTRPHRRPRHPRAATRTPPPTRSSRSSSGGALLPRQHAPRRHPHRDGHPVRRGRAVSTRTPPCGSCTTCWRTAPTGSSSPAAPARAPR